MGSCDDHLDNAMADAKAVYEKAKAVYEEAVAKVKAKAVYDKAVYDKAVAGPGPGAA